MGKREQKKNTEGVEYKKKTVNERRKRDEWGRKRNTFDVFEEMKAKQGSVYF